MRQRRTIFYILLNIIISATVTLTVLWLWERTHQIDLPESRPISPPAAPQAAPAEAQVEAAQPTPPVLPPLDVTVIEISNVIGAGDLETERIQLNRLGDGDLWLTGWELRDEDGNIYHFPNLQLNKDSAVQVYTRSGTNSVIALYWGLIDPVFEVGETITLLDTDSNVRAVYQIP